MSETHTESTGLLEIINQDAARLIHHLRCSRAPDEALGEAAEHIRQAMEILAPHLQQGAGWSTISIASCRDVAISPPIFSLVVLNLSASISALP